jgi:hypothetical protein
MRRLVFTFLVVLCVAWGLGTLFLYGNDESLPSTADAVVVLSGDDAGVPEGQRLVGDGVAPTLVVSHGQSPRDAEAAALCRKPPKAVICVVGSGPAGAGTELQAISRVANDRHWKTLVVVSPQYQQLRVDRVLSRCADVRVVGYEVDAPWWRDAVAIPIEWVKLGVAETVRRGC